MNGFKLSFIHFYSVTILTRYLNGLKQKFYKCLFHKIDLVTSACTLNTKNA